MSNFIKQLPVGLSGVNADYWVKHETKINAFAKHILIRVVGYLDKAAYDNGATPVDKARIDYNITNWIETLPDTSPQANEGDTIEIEHNDYDSFMSQGTDVKLDTQLNKHIKQIDKNTILADATDG